MASESQTGAKAEFNVK